MKLETGCVYENGRGSYILVLNTTKYGCSMVYLNNSTYAVDTYKNFPELFIDGTCGAVCFDRVIYVAWTKMSTKSYNFYKKICKKNYRIIIHYIADYYIGDINMVNSVFDYSESPNNSNKNASSKTNDTYSSHHKPNPAKLNKNNKNGETSNKEDTQNNEIIVSRSASTTKFESNTKNNIEIAKSLNIPIYSKDDEKDSEGTKYYDLSCKEKYSKTKSYNRVYNTKPIDNELSRNIFSEEECLQIALSDVGCVMDKYHVTTIRARTMIRNAKKIFELDNVSTKHSAVKNNLKELFDEGLSVDEICNRLPDVSRSKVSYYVKVRNICKNNAEAIDKWDKIFANQDIDKILNVVNTTINEFSLSEKCSRHIACTIEAKAHNILSMNLFYTVFGSIAYSNDFYNSIIGDKSKKSREIAKKLYDKVDSIKDIYTKTFYQHSDILIGVKDIPECLNESDKEFYLAMIYNRFNHYTMKKSRILTENQKNSIRNRDTEAVALAFAVPYKKAVNIISNSY